MLKEEDCPAHERYLYAGIYFSDTAIEKYQKECIERCKEKLKGKDYEKFINWKRQTNEIAVFTLYAYADIKIPKKFGIIFQLDNPEKFVKTDFELTQSIWEAWVPSDCIDHGHKHLCVFKFEEKLPFILGELQPLTTEFSTLPFSTKGLGFCSSSDFESIARNIFAEKQRSAL